MKTQMIVTHVLVALAVGSLDTSVFGGPIPTTTFVDRCNDLSSLYNSAAGIRNVTFSFPDMQGHQIAASAQMRFEASEYCVANTTSASIRLRRINNIDITVRVTFSGDGTGAMKVTDVYTDCAERYPDYLIGVYEEQGVFVDGTLRDLIARNARTDVCPAFKTSVENDLVSVLGG